MEYKNYRTRYAATLCHVTLSGEGMYSLYKTIGSSWQPSIMVLMVIYQRRIKRQGPKRWAIIATQDVKVHFIIAVQSQLDPPVNLQMIMPAECQYSKYTVVHCILSLKLLIGYRILACHHPYAHVGIFVVQTYCVNFTPKSILSQL